MKTDSLSDAIATLKDCDARLKTTLAAGRRDAERCAAAIAAQRSALRSAERTEVIKGSLFLLCLAASLWLAASL